MSCKDFFLGDQNNPCLSIPLPGLRFPDRLLSFFIWNNSRDYHNFNGRRNPNSLQSGQYTLAGSC